MTVAAPQLAERERAVAAFFAAEQERLARCCHDLARSFSAGGTLIPFGVGAAATDAAHVAVEFMHPVIVGKRALPALAAQGELPAVRAGDTALGISHGAHDEAPVAAFLADARSRGLVTIGMGSAGNALDADYVFSVPSDDAPVVQEVQETAYHVLWELVHVFFEHPGLLADACITCGDVAVQARVVAVGEGVAVIEKDGAREDVATDLVPDVRAGDVLLCHAGVALDRVDARDTAPEADDPSGFLYPFLDSSEADLDAVLADVRASTLRKAADITGLRAEIDLEAVERCAADVRARLRRGGRLIAFGNGGSSTDAQDAAIDCRALGHPAVALNDDVATITAVGNDVGFDNVFARQLIPLARAEDVALGISTSGSSANVIAAFDEARRRGMLTVGIAGYDGGRMGELGWLDHLFVAGSDYIPRLQEAHATIYHLLLEAL